MPDLGAPRAESTIFPLRAVVLTGTALVAFAGNSLLCRLALRDAGTDPVGFTTVRLCSAALMLWILIRLRSNGRGPHGAMDAGGESAGCAGSWRSAIWLFSYAILFSYAYVEVEAGTGALLLFGAVQATMILLGLLSGERPPWLEWFGLALAVAGVVYMVAPSLDTPAMLPGMSMVLAGIAWGFYSLRGRGVADPARATCQNFIRTVPMGLVVAAVFFTKLRMTTEGLLAAVASGALASGLGYILWYRALAYLTATRAAIVQLLAPVLAAIGGVAFLSESMTSRLVVAAALVFGGVICATTATSARSRGT